MIYYKSVSKTDAQIRDSSDPVLVSGDNKILLY